MRTCLIALLVLLGAACSPGRDASADGEIAQQATNDELDRAVAADPVLREAVEAIDAGHPWKATLALASKLSQKKPATTLIAARAAAQWGGWSDVERLLANERWIDSAFNGEARELLARAALESDSTDAALGHAIAAVRLAGSNRDRGERQVYLARALDRADQTDSAAKTYRAAAKNLPSVADWLLLRAAGNERSSDARRDDYSGVKFAPAKARIDWTEAQARERFGNIEGAIERFTALRARMSALRLRMASADEATKSSVKDSLLAFLRGSPSRDDVRQAVEVLDGSGVVLEPANELVIARALASPGPLPRALTAFANANRARLLTDDDRYQYALALSRSSRNREAMAQLDSIRAASLMGRAAYQRARIVMSSQGAGPAMTALRSVADRFPSDAENASAALYLLADLTSDAGNIDRSVALYRELYTRHPRSSRADDARFRAAITELARGNVKRAAPALDSIVTQFPNSNERTAARYWSGRAWAAQGNRERARQAWESIIADQPTSYYATVSARRLDRTPWAPPAAPDSFPRIPSIDEAFARIELLRALGMDAEADFEVAALVEAARTSKDTALATGYAFREHGDGTRSINIGLRLIEQGERDARAYRLAYPLVDREELERHARLNKLDPALVAGLIRQESSFNPRAVSVANARGLMQVLPSVGASIAKTLRYPAWSPSLLFDADVNLQLGTAHLAAATGQYKDIVKVLAAYNAGGSRVDRWSRKVGASSDPELFAEQIPYVETRDYVRIVQRNAAMYRSLYGLK